MALESDHKIRIRKHKEDILLNPKRHIIDKDKYTRNEYFELCLTCALKAKQNYCYDHETNMFVRLDKASNQAT